MRASKFLPVSAIALLALLLTGCVSAPPKKPLPYAWPETKPTTTEAARPRAVIKSVVDGRQDRSLETFLDEPLPETLKRIVAAELMSEGVFSRVEAAPLASAGANDIELSVVLEEAAWSVPDYERKLKTAFWTSFLTGGIGGIAYGSTDTPVHGKASLSVTAMRPGASEFLFVKRAQALHEESMAKFSSDTLDTRLSMSALALKKAMLVLRADMRAHKDVFLPLPTVSAKAPAAP